MAQKLKEKSVINVSVKRATGESKRTGFHDIGDAMAAAINLLLNGGGKATITQVVELELRPVAK